MVKITEISKKEFLDQLKDPFWAEVGHRLQLLHARHFSEQGLELAYAKRDGRDEMVANITSTDPGMDFRHPSMSQARFEIWGDITKAMIGIPVKVQLTSQAILPPNELVFSFRRA